LTAVRYVYTLLRTSIDPSDIGLVHV